MFSTPFINSLNNNHQNNIFSNLAIRTIGKKNIIELIEDKKKIIDKMEETFHSRKLAKSKKFLMNSHENQSNRKNLFYLVARTLKLDELSHDQLKERLNNRGSKFGNILRIPTYQSTKIKNENKKSSIQIKNSIENSSRNTKKNTNHNSSKNI